MDKRPYDRIAARRRFYTLLVFLLANVVVGLIHWRQGLLFGVLAALEGTVAILFHVRHHVEEPNCEPGRKGPVAFFRRLISSDLRATIACGTLVAATTIAAVVVTEAELGEFGRQGQPVAPTVAGPSHGAQSGQSPTGPPAVKVPTPPVKGPGALVPAGSNHGHDHKAQN